MGKTIYLGIKQSMAQSRMHTTNSIINDLDNGAVIFTANQRLCAYLRDHIAKNKKNLPRYKSPAVYNWKSHLKQQVINIEPNKHLLTAAQSAILWQQTAPEPSKICLGNQQNAYLAEQAWVICHEWLIDPEDLLPSRHLEVEQFVMWQRRFKALCETKSYIHPCELQRLAATNTNVLTQQYKKIYWLGFNKQSPALENISDNFKLPQQNTNISQGLAESFICACSSPEQEIQNMLAWLKTLNNDQAYSTACVFPNLEDIRDKLELALSNIFPDHNEQNPIYNISLGRSLNKFPLFASLEELLQVANEEKPMVGFCKLLTSALFTKNKSIQIKLYRIETKMRENLDLSCTKANICNYLQKISHNMQDDTCLQIKKWIKFLEHDPTNKKTISQWLIQLENITQDLGWPGQMQFNSHGHQLWERWLKLCDEIDSLDFISEKVSLTEFHNIYKNCITTSIFQFKNKKPAPIQILGIMEAISIPFQQIWMGSMDNKTWPGAASPSPFLPIELQCKLQTAHCNSEYELEVSEIITKKILQQCSKCIFSYSKTKDNEPRQLSSIIKHLKPQAYVNEECVTQAIQLKTYSHTDDNLQPLIEPDLTAGGSSVLNAMATCPMAAQLRWRMSAKQLEQWKIGPGALARGQLVHSCLEEIWRNLNNKQQLLACTEDELKTHIDAAWKIASRDILKKADTNMTKTWLRNEEKPCKTLLHNWLENEKHRPNFKVHEIESEQTITLDKLTLKLRIDRVDILDDGTELLIDYKTGNCSYNELISSHTSAAQLPLYYLTRNSNQVAVSYAQINQEKTKFCGISEHETNIDGINSFENIKSDYSDWAECTESWRQQLTHLAADFAQGNSCLSPIEKHKTCDSCAYSSICRIKIND